MKPLILVTNDDGYRSEGIQHLAARLATFGEVFIVAPEEERSAVSHALTVRDPVRLKKISEKIFAVHGTPADCVILAIRAVLPRRPALVVSGINHGRNLGDDIMYSGTIAGAREACYLDLPAFAVSQQTDGPEPRFELAARFASHLAERVIAAGLPDGVFLNVNVPNLSCPLGIRWTHQGLRISRSSLSECPDPRGNKFYWIGEEFRGKDVGQEEDSDYDAIENGYISITPLQRDQTSYKSLRSPLARELAASLDGI